MFEPFAEPIEDVPQDITKTMTETSNENNKTLVKSKYELSEKKTKNGG